MKIFDFNINYIKFSDKYYDSIYNNIKLKYDVLYNNVNIVYKICKNIYCFLIYVDLEIITENENKYTSTLIYSYSNIEAINLFSDISMEEYLEQYDDSKKNYLKQFDDFLNSIHMILSLSNYNCRHRIELNPKQYNTPGFYLVANSINKKENEYTWMNDDLFISDIFHFNNMITKKEYNKFIKLINRKVNKLLKKGE